MGLTTNCLLLLFIINMFLYIGGYDSIASITVFGISETEGGLAVDFSVFWFGVIAVAITTGIGIAVGTFWTGVNQYMLFGTIATALIVIFVTPLSFLSDPTMPIILKGLVGGIFIILYSMGILGFYRGTSEP